MKLTTVQRLILYSLGEFYASLNQPLEKTPLQVRTSKIAFIELLLESGIITTKVRALYKNLESLEKKKLITYQNRMILFTNSGLKELKRLQKELQKFMQIKTYFQSSPKPRRKLQTMIKGDW